MSEPVRSQPEAETPAAPPVVVKKYANRRLYNTESSSYITLDNLAEMIRLGRDFVVFDAKSGDDITRGVLTQIIVEEEGKGRAMLPISFLRHLIGFYGGNVQNIVPRYLEQAMTAFAEQQKQVRDAMQQTMGRIFPFGNIEEVGRQNMAIMERAMTLWSPFYRPPHEAAGGPPEPDPTVEEIAALRAEVEALRAQLAQTQSEALARMETGHPAAQVDPAPAPQRPAKQRQPAEVNTKT